VRYHHIIDPHTGHSASKVRSATVIGPYATRTDGLSKTAFVLGPDKALEIYNRLNDIDAIIVKLDGTVVTTDGMKRGNRPQGARRPAVRRVSRDQSRKLLNCSGTSKLPLRRVAIAS
jgi:hypothetical protein